MSNYLENKVLAGLKDATKEVRERREQNREAIDVIIGE